MGFLGKAAPYLGAGLVGGSMIAKKDKKQQPSLAGGASMSPQQQPTNRPRLLY